MNMGVTRGGSQNPKTIQKTVQKTIQKSVKTTPSSRSEVLTACDHQPNISRSKPIYRGLKRIRALFNQLQVEM